MKKIMFALLGLIIFTVGCKTVEVTTTTEIPASQKVGPKLQPLTQRYVNDLSKKDSALFFADVYFYNRAPIDLTLFIFDKNKPFTVVDGVAQKEKTDVDLLKTVPEMTSGKITDWRFEKNNLGKIIGVLVTFDADDRSFKFKFHVRSDGTFILIPDAVVIYKNQEYKVNATNPVGSKECILMFYGEEKATTLKINENAKGFKGGNQGSSTNQSNPLKTDETNW